MRLVNQVGLALALFWGQVAGAVDLPPSVEALLAPLRQSGMAEQADQLSQAIAAAPALANQLADLATSHKLTGINIATQPKAPFGGFIEDSRLVFTAPFLQAQVKKRLFDVVREGDILPDNLVFCLGHLAYHLEAGPVRVSDATNPMDYASKRIRKEAGAFIRGWNDTLDAAVRENGDKDLNPMQVGQMMMNLRYRFAFLKAINQVQKPSIAPSGRIELAPENINAIAEVLKTSQITDLE